MKGSMVELYKVYTPYSHGFSYWGYEDAGNSLVRFSGEDIGLVVPIIAAPQKALKHFGVPEIVTEPNELEVRLLGILEANNEAIRAELGTPLKAHAQAFHNLSGYLGLDKVVGLGVQ